jgi:phosphate transport system substrate-binding protein
MEFSSSDRTANCPPVLRYADVTHKSSDQAGQREARSLGVSTCELDTKARQDIQRLARYLQKNRTPPQVLLAGFTDDIGSASANLELARKRADAVRRELVALGAQRYARDVQVDGFGKVLPVACNDTELGRQKNRRVEVFVVR